MIYFFTAVSLLMSVSIPFFLEIKLFRKIPRGRDHIWNVLVCILCSVLLLYCLTYLVWIPFLGFKQNPVEVVFNTVVLSLPAMLVTGAAYALVRPSVPPVIP